MKKECPNCYKNMIIRCIPFNIRRKDYQLRVQGVPSYVCLHCGEIFPSQKNMKVINKLAVSLSALRAEDRPDEIFLSEKMLKLLYNAKDVTYEIIKNNVSEFLSCESKDFELFEKDVLKEDSTLNIGNNLDLASDNDNDSESELFNLKSVYKPLGSESSMNSLYKGRYINTFER